MIGEEGKRCDALTFSGQGEEGTSQERLKLWPVRLEGKLVSSQPWNPRDESISGRRVWAMLLRDHGKKTRRMCSGHSSREIHVDFDNLCEGFTNKRAKKKIQRISS